MKKLMFTAVIVFSCLSFKFADAQVTFSAGINIGQQPEWAPVGYDHADYYYLPDVNAYYDVQAHLFVVNNGQGWHHVEHLPYNNYDIYHSYKVVVNEREPWRRNEVYRSRYAQYRGRHDQVIIRDSRDNRYRNHWHGNAGHDNGRGNSGHDNGHHGGDGHDHGHDHGRN